MDTSFKGQEETSDTQKKFNITHTQAEETMQGKKTMQNSITSKNNPALEKVYNKALKELGIRTTSKIKPNLNVKRSFSQSINTDLPNSSTESLDDWQSPKKTNKKTRAHTTQINNEISMVNRFKPISLETDAPEDISKNNPFSQISNTMPSSLLNTSGIQTKNQHQKSHTQFHAPSSSLQPPTEDTQGNNDNQGNGIQPTKQRSKPPPLHILNSNIDQVINILKNYNLIRSEFYVKQKDTDACTVFCGSLNTFNIIQKVCKEKNLKFYTYTPKDSKPRSLILKGIAGNISVDEISQEIKELNLPNINVIKIAKINLNKKNTEINHFLIQITSDSVIKNLTGIRSLAYQRVYWEPLRKKKLFQCTNCQRIGHASINCSLGYRCVKCKENHNPGECKLSKNIIDKSQLYCVNCEQNGHPASYRGCPFFKFTRVIKNDLENTNKAKRSAKINQINSNVTKPSHTHKVIQPSYNTPPITKPSIRQVNTQNRSHGANSHANAWNNHANSIQHLFEDDNSQNTYKNQNSFFHELKTEINQTFTSNFEKLFKMIEMNSLKINHLYESLGVEFEHQNE